MRKNGRSSRDMHTYQVRKLIYHLLIVIAYTPDAAEPTNLYTPVEAAVALKAFMLGNPASLPCFHHGCSSLGQLHDDTPILVHDWPTNSEFRVAYTTN